jgi:hypothetical protein
VNINKYICTGRLTKDPELRELPNGTSVFQLTIELRTATLLVGDVELVGLTLFGS